MTRTLDYRLTMASETIHGTTNANPACLILETMSSAPSASAPKQQSATIRRDGNVKSSVPTNRSATFGRTQELVIPTINQGLWTEIRAGMRTTEATITADATCTLGATNTMTTLGDFVADGWQPGDILKLSGSVEATDNTYVRVATVTTGTLTVAQADGYTWQGDGGTVTTTGGFRMTNGTTDYSYTLEECWIVSPYNMMTWTGMRVSGFSLGFTMGSKSTYSVNYVGWDGTPGTMTAGAATPPQGLPSGAVSYTAYTESPIFTPKDTIIVCVNNETLPVRSLSISVENGARVRHSTSGGAVPDAVQTGTFRCRVTMEAYASVLSGLTQSRAGTEVPVWCVMEDPDGAAIAISLGTVVWDTASLPTSGMDQDAMVSVTGTATVTADATNGDWTMRFQRFAA